MEEVQRITKSLAHSNSSNDSHTIQWNLCVQNRYLLWNGGLFSRRLLVTLVFVFVPGHIWRLMLMFWAIFPFLAIHKIMKPCRDASANIALFFFLLGSEIVTLANLIKSAILESLTENEDAENIARFYQHAIDIVLIWIPLSGCLLYLIVQLQRQMRFVRKKCKGLFEMKWNCKTQNIFGKHGFALATYIHVEGEKNTFLKCWHFWLFLSPNYLFSFFNQCKENIKNWGHVLSHPQLGVEPAGRGALVCHVWLWQHFLWGVDNFLYQNLKRTESFCFS